MTLVYDFHHPITADLAAAEPGFLDLSDTDVLPALDFMRSDILNETGVWRMSDVIDGSNAVEPIASVTRLVTRAKDQGCDIYIFGRRYVTGGEGIHDIHMNQGSTGSFCTATATIRTITMTFGKMAPCWSISVKEAGPPISQLSRGSSSRPTHWATRCPPADRSIAELRRSACRSRQPNRPKRVSHIARSG